MILQEEFKKSGYKDILVGDIASEYEINLEDVFDLDQKPEELLTQTSHIKSGYNALINAG